MWIEAGAEVGNALVEGIINENEDENDNIKKRMLERKEIGKVKASIKIKRAVWNVVCVIFFRPFITKIFRS